MADRPPVSPWFVLSLGVFAISTGAIFARMAEAPPLVIAAYRVGLATLFLLPFTARRAVREIASQVENSARMATDAVRDADHTASQVQDLANKVQKIGEIVELISGVAAQTNLLALNATIEAARKDLRIRAICLVAGHYLTPQVARMYLGGEEAVAARDSAVREFFSKLTGCAEDSIEVIGEALREIEIPGESGYGSAPPGTDAFDLSSEAGRIAALDLMSGCSGSASLDEAARNCRLLWDLKRVLRTVKPDLVQTGEWRDGSLSRGLIRCGNLTLTRHCSNVSTLPAWRPRDECRPPKDNRSEQPRIQPGYRQGQARG